MWKLRGNILFPSLPGPYFVREGCARFLRVRLQARLCHVTLAYAMGYATECKHIKHIHKPYELASGTCIARGTTLSQPQFPLARCPSIAPTKAEWSTDLRPEGATPSRLYNTVTNVEKKTSKRTRSIPSVGEDR